MQVFKYEQARGSGFRCQDACDFAVKPEDGRDVNEFFCTVKFQQEGDDEEHEFDVYPGFPPLKVEKNTQSNRGSLFFPFDSCVSLVRVHKRYGVGGCLRQGANAS